MSKILFQDQNLLHQKTTKPNRYQFVIVRAYVCYTSSQVEHKKVRHDSFMMSFYTILHTLFVQYASIYLFHLPILLFTTMEFILNIANHRLRTHDGYFPSSLRPISYLGYIWVSSEKQRFKVEKTTEVTVPKKGADSLAENTPKFIRPIFIIGPEVWGIV